MRQLLLLFFVSLFAFQTANAQKATLKGKIIDANEKYELIGVNVLINGTSLGAATGIDGSYIIPNISPGEYNIEISYLGYEKKLYTAIKFIEGEVKVMDLELGTAALTTENVFTIIGDAPLVDIEDSKTKTTISKEVIAAAPTRGIEGLINSQTGVVQNAEGIHIRGGRSYETGFYIDGVSAQDPLAGTGFGIDLGSNSINKLEVTTGGAGAEYGNATAGVVNANTQSGGKKIAGSFAYKRDNFGFNKDWSSSFNEQVLEASLGGPLKFKFLKGKLRWFTSFKVRYTDHFTKAPADQVVSSLYDNTTFSPFQDNRHSGLIKLDYTFKPGMKLTVSYLKSLTVNQDRNMLRITGSQVSYRPGYQYNFALSPDNANTYTHDTNLENVKWQHAVSDRFTYKMQVSRLFVKLRADANGRDWRPENVDSEFEPISISEFPGGAFNPEDSIVFVNPGPGLFNNGGIATLWHDHFVEEYTFKGSFNLYSKNTFNRFTGGMEVKRQDLQWVDIVRPWIGAPVVLPDGTTSQSFRLGDISDVWRVQPLRGAFFGSNKIKYKGLIAEVGARLEYWAAGKFVDDAVENPNAPIRDEIRQAYRDDTYKIAGMRFKMRLLPKVSASFPIKENQVMFFNYGHSTVAPHPSYIYQGLDPQFTDQSTLSRLGNPNLDPEVDISYELGLKSQITSNDALNFTAFWKDKYDFITSTSILVEDITGKEVSRTMRINSDYARVRGIEIAYIKRIGKWFNGQVSASYSVATGQSSSSDETIKDIASTGNRETTKETPLAWDSPLDLKAFALFTVNKKEGTGLFGKKSLNKMSFYWESVFRTGRRYTPYIYVGDEPNSGRPIYEQDEDPEKRYSKLGAPTFNTDITFKKWWNFKKTKLSVLLEVTNLFNLKNTQIVNPITGRAYQEGDDVPTEWRDPRYIDPRDPRSNNTPPTNPSRFSQQRHVVLGVQFGF